ncbi:uncharacterized protein N7483_009864 [Penicillium malachiteum]|uniref:uncharacterized protein n=1 Tax=Penicillium malachiteum TaxID=1324776 RepID=UPI00254891D7|nr:uncharacterized protein N7483_009864 [Penicillium malachiteum]KAJ5721930.1 hypothetical protein N7483_009864 [Penicillium malachiteum]
MPSSNHPVRASPQPEQSLILDDDLPASLLENIDLEEWYGDIDDIGHESHHVHTFFQQLLSHWIQTSTIGSIRLPQNMHEFPYESKPDLAMCYGSNNQPPYILLFLGEESEFPDREGLAERLREMATSYLRSMGQIESEVMIAGIAALGKRVKFSIWTRQPGSERVEISPSYWRSGDLRGSPENWGMSIEDPLFRRFLCEVAEYGYRKALNALY